MPTLRRSIAMLLVWVASVVGTAALAPHIANAQSPPESSDDATEAEVASGDDQQQSTSAQHHYRKGAEAFRTDDYTAAIEHFRRAYELKPDGMLLYNLALVHAADGQRDRAIWYAEQAKTSGDLTGQVRLRNTGRLVALRVAASSDAVAVRIGSTEAEEPADRTETTDQATDPSPSPEPRPTRRSSSSRTLLWGGVSLAAVGLGGLGGAAGLEVSLEDDLAQYREAARAGDRRQYEQLRTRIGRRQRFGRALLVGGAVATGLGATLAIVDLTLHGSPTGITLGPSPTGSIGLTLSTRR